MKHYRPSFRRETAAEVPYYRQILPTFALYIGKNKNLGHLMDYAQRKRLNLGELIHETLEILEAHGGHSCHQSHRFQTMNFVKTIQRVDEEVE